MARRWPQYVRGKEAAQRQSCYRAGVVAEPYETPWQNVSYPVGTRRACHLTISVGPDSRRRSLPPSADQICRWRPQRSDAWFLFNITPSHPAHLKDRAVAQTSS